MKYFKNSELARLHNVSEKSVRNWILAVLEGRSEVDLYKDEKGRYFIANTTKNELLLQEQVEQGKKFRNSRTYKVTSPSEEFYSTYTGSQIVDIIGALDKRSELPFQYCHMGPGAELAEEYYQRLFDESEVIANPQSYSFDTLPKNKEYLLELLSDKNINLVEIGGRTGLTCRALIKELLELQKLGKYVDIDVSQDMLNKTAKNIAKLFGDEVDFHAYQRDISRDLIDDILCSGSQDQERNLVMFLGGTLWNLDSPKRTLQIISDSLGLSDVFVLTMKLDCEEARRYFDFSGRFTNQLLDPKNKATLALLGIDESMYDVEQFYEAESRSRRIQIRLKFDVTLVFNLNGHEKRVDFSKGEAILLWRYWHKNLEEIEDMMREAGFSVMQATKSPDEQFGMIIAKVKSQRP